MFKKLLDKVRGKKPTQVPPYTDPALASILYRNTIDQTPYTKKALDVLKRTPLEVWGKDASMIDQGLGQYSGGGYGSSILHPSQPGWTRGGKKYNTVETVRHENLHALDQNINNPTSGKSNRYPANSLNFSKLLAKVSPSRNKSYNYVPSDIERFAVLGSVDYFDPQAKMPQKLKDPYNDVYMPMTKNINYSPFFPSDETLSRRKGAARTKR